MPISSRTAMLHLRPSAELTVWLLYLCVYGCSARRSGSLSFQRAARLSLQWYDRAFHSEIFLQPALPSITIAFSSAAVSSLVAVSLGLQRRLPSALRRAIKFFLFLSLFVPALILGIVDDHAIRIIGDKATLAQVAAGRASTAAGVRSCVRKWRTRGDSNS